MDADQAKAHIKAFAKQGAVETLTEIGFYDEQGRVDKKAVSDFTSLRGMLKDWREFKSATGAAIIKWVMWIALGLLSIKLGLVDYLKIGRGS